MSVQSLGKSQGLSRGLKRVVKRDVAHLSARPRCESAWVTATSQWKYIHVYTEIYQSVHSIYRYIQVYPRLYSIYRYIPVYTSLYTVYTGIYLSVQSLGKSSRLPVPWISSWAMLVYSGICTSRRISSWVMLVYSGTCPIETILYVCVSFLRIPS